tara:strand:+ start:255 stop:482 length:228 start_codon:yes stop_codon:yes gene_type:complete
MPQYGAVHYPNDGAGSPRLQKGSVEVKDNNAKNKFGINDHVPNGRDTFGDPIARNATGFDKRDVLRGDPDSLTNS